MKIVKIIGGLGNQMFQYALAMALKKNFTDEEVKLDIHCFNGYTKHQGFEIDRVFGNEFELASYRNVAKVAYPYFNFQFWRIGSRILPDRRHMVSEDITFKIMSEVINNPNYKYYDGYWQHEEYFKNIHDEILDAFKFPKFQDERNKALAERLSDSNSISIHIRRGDYLNDELFKGTCGIEYYKKAIDEINKRTNPTLFCIFSNDIRWCKENIEPLLNGKETIYVDWNTGTDNFRDMQLMTKCEHCIIANSSFSWWGAWLNNNKDKIVFAPRIWYNTNDKVSPAASSWIKL